MNGIITKKHSVYTYVLYYIQNYAICITFLTYIIKQNAKFLNKNKEFSKMNITIIQNHI